MTEESRESGCIILWLIRIDFTLLYDIFSFMRLSTREGLNDLFKIVIPAGLVLTLACIQAYDYVESFWDGEPDTSE